MLLRFTFENFGCFRDRQTLSFVATSDPALPENVIPKAPGTKHGILRSLAIYGANASGKSTVIQAFQFMLATVLNSYRFNAPEQKFQFQPFLLDGESKNNPTFFECEFIYKNIVYEYGFMLTQEKIIEEWLYFFPNRRRQILFHRSENFPTGYKFGHSLEGPKKTIASITQKNVLFSSSGAYNNMPLLRELHLFAMPPSGGAGENKPITYGNRNFSEMIEKFSYFISENKNFKKQVINLLQRADVGIHDISIEQFVSDIEGKISFLHNASHSKSVKFSIFQESLGTLQILFGAVEIFATLNTGKILLADEFGNSFHPHIVRYILSLFHSGDAEKTAQLLYVTHSTEPLDSTIMRRDQIWFTEKDAHGAARLYPLSDFHKSKNENMSIDYLLGRFGAIPMPGLGG